VQTRGQYRNLFANQKGKRKAMLASEKRGAFCSIMHMLSAQQRPGYALFIANPKIDLRGSPKTIGNVINKTTYSDLRF
jgi:hypothetical protein